MHVTARALHQPLFRHSLGTPVDDPDPVARMWRAERPRRESTRGLPVDSRVSSPRDHEGVRAAPHGGAVRAASHAPVRSVGRA